jgi:hypothetical protein
MSESLFVFAKRKKLLNRAIFALTAFLIAVLSIMPLMTMHANAAGQISNRSLTLSTAIAGQTGVSYTYSFRTFTNNANILAIKFIACTSAVGSYPSGSCTAPAGIRFDLGSFNNGATAGFTDTTNAFTNDTTGANDCLSGASHPNTLCLKRTTTTGNDTNNTTNKTIQFTGITNPTTANSSFYVGITTYSANTYTAGSIVDAGTVAAAVVQSLTVQAQVAEILQFCVGNENTITDATTTDTVSPASDCSGISGTTVNIGTLDPAAVNISPVTTNGGNSTMGIAMLRSNAANGATVSYRAVQATSGSNHLGTLRLAGASCSAASGIGTGSGGTPPAASGPYTDSCIDAAGTTQNAFSAGVEQFGMTVASVDCASATSYTCTYSGGTNNLQQQTNYIGGANSTTFGASAAKGFAWDESGSTQTIASSTSSTIKQVDDEALILAFAATPSITTPFGSYTVQADFIAVPGY